MAIKDEAREAADGTEIQVEAVDLGTVHFEAHPEVKLPSIMEIKNVGENTDSAEGMLKIPEDQVLVEAPSEVELAPEHNLNGKTSSLNGHMDKEQKISNEQPHENDQEEAELDGTIAHQSNGISKEEVTDSLSHGESKTEDNSLLKHEKDEEPSGDDQQDLEGVTVDVDSVQEDTLKTDSAIEETDDGQQDQNQEPEKANGDTQPASTANNADVEVVAEAPTVLQIPVEPNLDDSGTVPGTINEKMKTEEPDKADGFVHPDHKEGFPEETSTAEPTEEAVKLEDQQSQQAYMMDADVVQEEMLKREETHVQEEVPNSEAHDPTTNAQETLNKESAEEIDDPMNENNEETVNQSNMEAPKETTPELDTATRAPPVNVQVQNHEPSEEIEHAEAVDTEAEKQQSSVAFEDAILEDQHNLSVTMDNDPVQEDTLKAIEQKDDGQQEQDREPEKTTEDTQPTSMANIPDEVVAEAPSGVQTPVEPNLESHAIPDTIDGNTETDEPAKADGVVHPDHKESFPEHASIAEPAEEVVKAEDQQSQQADAMDADVVQEDVPKSEHDDEPATNAHEVLNQESTEETDGPVNEKTEESAHQSNMAAPEETTPENDRIMLELPVNIQVPNQESVEEIEDAEAAMEQNTLQAIEKTEDDPRDHDLGQEKATENTPPATMASIPDVEVVAPVVINLDNSNAIPDTADGNTETDESAKAEDATATSEPQVTETEDEPKGIEVTEAQEITKHGHVTPSKELSAEDDSTADEPHNDDIQQTLGQDLVEVKETVFTSEDNVEDNVTAEEPTCDSQEVDNAESTEETKGNTAENIAEVSDVVIVDAIEEQNVLETGDIAETHMRELEPEETKNTEPVESEEPSDQRNAVLLDDVAQEDTPESEMQQKESATETTENEAAPQESNDCVSEEPSPEDHKIESETECDTQEVSTTESLEVIDGDKDIITGGSSGQSNIVSAGVSAQENNVLSEPTADIQPVQELEPEPEEIKNTKLAEMKETSHEMNTTIFQTPIEEHNPATIDLHESAREMNNIEATEVGTPHQSDAAQSEEQAPEGIASEPQVPEPESVEEMNDTEATEPPNISQGNLISTSWESAPEEIATEDKKSTEPDGDHQQDQESTDFVETEANKPQGIASSSTLSTSEQTTSENNETETEPSSDTQAENSEPPEVTEGAENVKSNNALAEAAASEEHVETDATADTSSVQEPEREETKDAEPAGTEDIMTSSDPPAENMGMETMGTEAVPRVKELTEDDTTAEETHNDDIQQTLGQEPDEVKETFFTSEDDTVVDNVTAEEPTCDSQEVDNSESTEETKGNTSENIAEVSSVVIVDDAVEEQNELQAGDIAETHMRELEPEETKNTEPVESEQASDQRNAVLFDDLAQEATPESEMQQTESATETTETEVAPQESNDCVSEEPSPEDHKIESETDCDIHEANITESLEVIDGDKDIITGGVSGQSNMVSAGESAQEKDVPESEPAADIHSVQESVPEEIKNTELVEVKETSHEMNTNVFQTPNEVDNPTTITVHESARELSNIEATEMGTPHQSDAAQSEEQAPEGIASEPQVPEPESVEEINDTEAIEPPNISQGNLISTSGESAPEEIAAEDDSTADEPHNDDIQQTLGQDLVEVKEAVFTSEDNVEGNVTAEEPTCDSQEVDNVESTEETKGNTAEPQVPEPESVEEMNDTEAIEPPNFSQGELISTSGESAPEEIATEDKKSTEADGDHQQDQESTDFTETEADKPQGIASSSTLSTSEQSISEDNETAKEPSADTQAENSEPPEVTEVAENVKSNTGLAEAAAPEEYVETDANADTSSVKETELEETKDAEPAGTEDIMTSSDLPAENMDMETMGTEAVPRESHVESIKELTEDDTEPVLELESVEDTKCTDTMEHPGEPHSSTSDEPTPTEENTTVTECDTKQVQNVISQEIKDSEDTKTDEFSDLSSFPTPEEADQESNLPRTEPTTDVQQEQELGSTEETTGIESVGAEDHQQQGVSALEEPAVDSELNVDDQQVHEDKEPEVKGNEAMEAEEVVQQSNIDNPDDATEEKSELRSDPDSYAQPAQHVELSRDSENNQLVKADEPSGQVNTVAIEETPTPTEDSFASEINPPVDIKQENEHEPMEEIMGIDAKEAEEEFHTSRVDATEKPASEGNVAPIEPTSDIKQDTELEATKEINGIEVINDGAQTENATSEGPSPTYNETTPERHPAKLNEETMGTETDDVMPVPGTKDEIQTSVELKDGACDLGETVLTTEGSENVTDEAAVQSPGDDIIETSNNIDQVKEEQKDGCEHNSSEMSGVQNVGNIIHVQDRDISGEPLTKRGTEEASQALFESDPQGAQDATKEDDSTEGGEQTSDLSKQPDDVALQLQTCEADALSIGRQDEVVQNVDLDQQQKEDEEIESQKEELQADEQNHEDKGDDFAMEALVEPEDIENGTKNKTEDTAEAEQTEAAITEILDHEEAPHVSEESTTNSMDMKVDNVKGTHEVTEEDADAKNDNKDEESAEKNDIVATDSTNEQDERTDEITNEELEPGLASSGQEASDPAPSNDDILENDPAVVTQNVESGEHSEDKECTDKVNDDVHAIQAEEEITGEINENREIRNEDNAINHDESQTKPEEEEASQLHSDEPCNMDAKIDDATTPCEEIIDVNASIKPRENEDSGENKGLDSTSEPFVESSVQNNVEQDLSSHQKVEDQKLSMAEQNDVDIEAASDMQEKADESASDINLTSQCQEEINTDDVQQLEIEENSSDKIDETVLHEKTETSTTEAVTINDSITNKASEAECGSSDGSLKTCNDTGRDLDVSSVITASKEESVNENMEDHKLALPAHLEKTEREMPSSQKILPTEPEENQIPNESNEDELQDENPIPNEKNEEDMKDAEIGDAQKDVEQDLPVSHFLMNLILGEKNSDADENSESVAERKQGETTEDNSCVLILKQEESVGSLSTENKVDHDLTFDQEKHDVKCSEETQEMVKEQSDDLKLDNERSIHTDKESNKNTRDLEILAYQGNPGDKISGEVSSEEEARVSTKMETRDIEISNLELDDKEVDTVCQEKTEASTKIENGSLKNNINDLTNTEASEEDTVGEGETGLLPEYLPEDKSAGAVSEKTPLLTESGMVDEKDLSCDAEAVQNLACAKEDATTEPSIKATITPDIQLECEEVEKKEEEKHASTATSEVSGEDAEISNDNVQKSTSSEVISDEQASQIREPVSDIQKILAHEKEISEGSTCMDEKESSKFSIKGVENFQADGPNIQVNQDRRDEVADNKTTMEPEKLGKSDFQEHQETATEKKSPKATDEGDQQLLVKKETMIKEQVVPRTVESHEQTVSIKSNEEQELFDSKVQECDLNVVSPREASVAEENFVDVTKPEFSTDEEQSPKADAEEKTCDEKIKDFTDGAATKTEVPGATQKARKKQNLLSGVGSKVKQQLAKVKKAIVRKPGNTKPDSPKS